LDWIKELSRRDNKFENVALEPISSEIPPVLRFPLRFTKSIEMDIGWNMGLNNPVAGWEGKFFSNEFEEDNNSSLPTPIVGKSWFKLGPARLSKLHKVYFIKKN
jgi:hypothetical protein